MRENNSINLMQVNVMPQTTEHNLSVLLSQSGDVKINLSLDRHIDRLCYY